MLREETWESELCGGGGVTKVQVASRGLQN